jgi:hypothetical protein
MCELTSGELLEGRTDVVDNDKPPRCPEIGAITSSKTNWSPVCQKHVGLRHSERLSEVIDREDAVRDRHGAEEVRRVLACRLMDWPR